MGNDGQAITRDTIDAWKKLVEISRAIFPKKHPLAAKTTSTEDMTAIVNERLAGTFTTENLTRRIEMLKHAFPSSPQRLPVCGFSIRHEDDRFQHVNFAATYAAKHFLDLLLEDLKFKWVTDYEVEVQAERYFWIRSDGLTLEAIIEHTFTAEENLWELPAPYPALVRQIRRSKAPIAEIEIEAPAIAPKPTPAVREKASPKPAKAPKPSAAGLITIGDVAATFGFDAKQARGIMRAANITKPSSGRWEWDVVPVLVNEAFKNAKKK